MAVTGPVRALESVLSETVAQGLQQVRGAARGGELIAIRQPRRK